MAEFLQDASQLESTTVKINRTAATVKGGRRMSFAALVVVGDRRGSVGIGYGKAPGVPAAIEKAQKDARKNLKKVTLHEGTLPHPVTGKFGASQVRLIPAAPGSGVIAGGTVRAVLEMAGVHDCLTKAYRSTNEINVVKAVLDGLLKLRTRDQVNKLRNVEIASTDVDEIIANSKKFLKDDATTNKAPQPLVLPPKPEAEKADETPTADAEATDVSPTAEATETPATEADATETTTQTPADAVEAPESAEAPTADADTAESTDKPAES